MLLRGFVKFVAVVLAAGLAGAGIGIALAELSGNDEAGMPLLPATTERAATSPAGSSAATATLVSRGDQVPLTLDARDAAGALLRPIAVGSSAKGALRFTVPGELAARLSETPAARLRIANRTVVVKLTTREGAG